MESDTSDSSEEQDLLMELGDEASPQEQVVIIDVNKCMSLS